MSASTGCSTREPASQLLPGLVDRDVPHPRVGPREVDELEDAEGALGRLGEPRAVQSAVVDTDQLPRLDVAHERRADDVERAGLRGDHEPVRQPADRQRPDAVGIARRVDAALVHEYERVRALAASAARASRPPRCCRRRAARRRASTSRGRSRWSRRPARRSGCARSVVLTRLPLWPRATERTPSVLNTGCAFSHVLEPVVE